MEGFERQFSPFSIPIIFYSGGGGNGSQGGPAGGGVRVFDIETSQEERSSLKGHEDYIHDMDYCPQSNALVSASGKVQSCMCCLRPSPANMNNKMFQRMGRQEFGI